MNSILKFDIQKLKKKFLIKKIKFDIQGHFPEKG